MDNPLWGYIFGPPKDKRTLIELLGNLPVFEGFSNNELVQISRSLHERHYRRDEIVFSEEEPSAGMYIIKSGSIGITKKIGEQGEMQLAEFGEREFFGELALLDEAPRSATARAKSESVLLGFCRPDLEKLMERNPRLGAKIVMSLARLICQRLIRANQNLEQLQDKLSPQNP